MNSLDSRWRWANPSLGENYFCSALDPAVCFVDHSAGLKAGCQETWNDIEANTCWPHISRKASEGEFLSKTHPIFDSLVGTLLPTVHLTHTALMMDLFVDLLGQVIHPYMTEEKLRTFWNTRIACTSHSHRVHITRTSHSHRARCVTCPMRMRCDAMYGDVSMLLEGLQPLKARSRNRVPRDARSV